MTMSLREMLAAFVGFREVVVTRRTKHLLGKCRERAHVLLGLAIAVANLDEIVALIRRSPDPAAAREALMGRDWPSAPVAALIERVEGAEVAAEAATRGTTRLSEAQARAILDLRLQRLTALERDRIASELAELAAEIAGYLEVLASRARLMAIVRDELRAFKERFADPRRTEIRDEEVAQDLEDLIQREDMVITVSHHGYVKRVPLSTYRAQRRGGKGRAGMTTREEDFVSQVFVASTHAPVLFFSTTGKVYRVKVHTLPMATPQARGKALVNLLPLEDGETVSTVMPLPEDEEAWAHLQVMFATASGHVRRNAMDDFANVPSNGKIAIKLDEGDRLVGVALCGEGQDVLLASLGGKCVRFPVAAVRVFKGRSSTGVRGIRLGDNDEVISLSILGHTEVAPDVRDQYLRLAAAKRRGEGEAGPPAEEVRLDPKAAAELEAREEFILAATEGGYGKRTSAYEYRITNRGGQGIINIDTSSRNGGVVAAFPVAAKDEIVIVTDGGQLIRCGVDDIRIAGRGTQGVKLIDVREGERVISVARLRDAGEDSAE
jgi:DNA gyrase subunit A